MPVLTIGAPDYPKEEWRRVLLWTFVAGVVGLAAQDLVEQVRQRAAALHTVSEAVGRRTREIETRSAICEAAKQNAGAQFALLLEPDTNERRLVTTAATDAVVEQTEFYLSDQKSPAVRTYQTGRGQFIQKVERSPLTGMTLSPSTRPQEVWPAAVNLSQRMDSSSYSCLLCSYSAAACGLAAIPLFIGLRVSVGGAIPLIMAGYGLLQLYYGLVYAAIQDLVGPECRGRAMAPAIGQERRR